MHHSHGQGQPLANPKWQGACSLVQYIFKTELPNQHRNTLRDFGVRQVKQPGMQIQILAHGELTIEREGLGHVAHLLPGGQVFGIQWFTEQPDFAFRWSQQSGEHFHGGGLATTVGSQKTEDFAFRDGKADVTNRRKAAKPQGQMLSLNGRRLVFPGWLSLRSNSRIAAFLHLPVFG